MENIFPFQVVQWSNVQNSCCFMISSGVKKRSNILGLSSINGKSYQQTTTKEGHRGLNRLVKGRNDRLRGLFAMLIRIYLYYINAVYIHFLYIHVYIYILHNIYIYMCVYTLHNTVYICIYICFVATSHGHPAYHKTPGPPGKYHLDLRLPVAWGPPSAWAAFGAGEDMVTPTTRMMMKPIPSGNDCYLWFNMV